MKHVDIDKFRKWVWHNITSFIDHAIQINVGQKDKEQSMEGSGFSRISLHCITVSSDD